MSDRLWLPRIEHILESIRRIEAYVSELDESSFLKDSLTQDAVLRNFQIIGEAARHIPDEIQKTEAHIPWANMQKMRHVIVHDYMRIDTYVVWQTIHVDLKPLVVPLQGILRKYS